MTDPREGSRTAPTAEPEIVAWLTECEGPEFHLSCDEVEARSHKLTVSVNPLGWLVRPCVNCHSRPRWWRAWADQQGEHREETLYCARCWGDPKLSPVPSRAGAEDGSAESRIGTAWRSDPEVQKLYGKLMVGALNTKFTHVLDALCERIAAVAQCSGGSARTWLISADIVEQSAKRAAASFIGIEPWAKPGVLTLYNKNANENYEFANPRPHPSRHAWIAERDECPAYFANVIQSFGGSAESFEKAAQVCEEYAKNFLDFQLPAMREVNAALQHDAWIASECARRIRALKEQ